MDSPNSHIDITFSKLSLPAFARREHRKGRPRAYQFIDSARVQTNLSTVVDKPTHERQARPLARLEPEQQKGVWKKAKIARVYVCGPDAFRNGWH